MTIFLFLLAGLVLLVVGGDALVRGAERMALRFGVSPLLIGLTIVGFGTSTPELVTSLQAAFAGAPGISVGNVVGSNIANILLILGLTALISPIAVARGSFRRDALMLGLSAALCLVIVLSGALGRWAGFVMIAVLAGYLFYCVRSEGLALPATPKDVTHDVPAAPGNSLLNIALIIGGLALTIGGAHLFVRGAISLATGFGISETIIGLTVVAVGTSLPELVASLMAAFRRQSDLALGNIVGSNIFNVLFILGATAIVHPIPVPAIIAQFDIWIMLAATAALILAGLVFGRVSRPAGAVLFTGYCGYTGWLASHAMA